MYLASEAWPDLEEYFETESLAVVPLGSTEQHGPALPEATDHLIAEGFAREATERADVLCTPTINVGVSPHHRQFHGTMWVDAPVFRDYVESFSRNLTYHGIDRLIYVNAHGGNTEHLREVGRRLHDDDTAYAIEWIWNDSIPEVVDELFEQPGPHGGPKETSMIQFLDSELVHDDRLEAARDGGYPDVFEDSYLRNGARTFYDAVENTPNGVLGDQTDASAEKGERLFEAATDQLVELIEWMRGLDDEELLAAPHV